MPLVDKYIQTLLKVDKEISLETYYHQNNGTLLRVIKLYKRRVQNSYKIVFIPGWASTIFSWRYFLPRILEEAEIHYFETREKSSSIVKNDNSFGINDFTSDVTSFLLENIFHNYILIGASFGGTLILESWEKIAYKPEKVILILPNKRLPIPRYTQILKFVPKSVISFLKPVTYTIVSNLGIRPSEEQQKEGLKAAISNANLDKLTRSAIILRNYELVKPSLLNCPTLVIGASRDTLHNYNAILEIHRTIQSSEFVDVFSFAKAHSKNTAEIIIKWIKNNG